MNGDFVFLRTRKLGFYLECREQLAKYDHPQVSRFQVRLS